MESGMRTLLCICCVAVFSSAVVAQKVKGVEIVKAEILSDAVDYSKSFTVGLRFVIESDWYLYWKNPGDSGLPIDVTWVLPKGWRAEELLHPVPQKFTHDNVVSYGYKKEVVLLTTITPKGSFRGPLKAKLDWLVCEKSCVRGKAEVLLDLGKQSAEKRREARRIISLWQERLPRPHSENPLAFQKAAATLEGAGLEIEIPFTTKGDVQIVDFFPSSVKGLLIDYRTISVKNGRLSFRGTLEGTGTGEIHLSGLLLGADGKAYECSVPVKFSSM
jgi:DsbC/DsbD-like thiol-disulfide interchange protein